MNKRVEFALKQEEKEDWELCTIKEAKQLLKDYSFWCYTQSSHCCRGWKECCWIDDYENGNWGLDFSRIRRLIKKILREEMGMIQEEPARFRKKILENGDIRLFLTLRDKEPDNYDFDFYGSKERF